MSMSTILDSEATFEQQAAKAGLSDPWIQALKRHHMATFSKLSFAISTPGTKRQHGPPLLRAFQWPDGLPTLRGVNLQKVRVAKRLYSFMASLILKLQENQSLGQWRILGLVFCGTHHTGRKLDG